MSEEWTGPWALDDLLQSRVSGYWGDGEASDRRAVPVNVVRNGDISRDGLLTGAAPRFFSEREREKSLIQPGDVLLTSSGEVGKVCLPKSSPGTNLVASNFVRLLRPSQEQLSGEFLRLVLEGPATREMLPQHTGGSTIPNLLASFFSEGFIRLPPKTIQRRITDLMAHLDGHLANLQAERQVGSSLLAQLREMLSAASDPVPLGELAAVDGIQIGPFGSQLHASEYVKVGIPVVMPRDITEGQISSTKIKQVAPETAARLSRHRLLPGDIVFPRRGDLSKRALVTAEQADWLCGTGCIRFRPAPGIDGGQVFQALSGERATAWLVEHAVGTTMLNLNTQILTSLPVPDPRVGESPVAAACEGLAALLAMLAAEESGLLTIRGALLSSLLSGAQAIETTYDTLLPEAS